LEECSVLSKSGRENDPSGDVNAEAVMFLKILGPYLDTWDARTLEEDEDQRMFRLYDQSSFERDNNDEFLQNENNISHPRSEAAADAMSTYIEIASSEKARLSDFVNTFLPSLRFSCQAYTERYCWSRYFETLNNNDSCGMSQMWERGISDGNRDIRSRLVTMPCHPQFKRYIPKYLDHAIDPEQVDDVSIPAPSLEPEGSAIGEIPAPSNVMSNTDLLSDTLRTLVQTGNLEIVDVTKKSVDEEEHLKLSAIPLVTEGEIDDLEDDIYGDGSLGFPSRDEDNNNIHENASSDVATAHDTEESESGITATRVSEKGQGTGNYYIASSIYGHPPDNSTSVSSLRHSFGPEMIEKQFDNCLHVRAEGSRKCFVLLSQTHVILEYDSESAGLYEGELMAVREEVERQKLIKECGGPSQQVDRDGVSRETIQDELERRLKETASLRPKSIRWNLSELSHVYLRRCRLRDSALEMFFIPSGGSSFGGFGLYSPSTSLFLDFGSGHDGNRRRDDAASSIMKRAPPQTIKQWPDRSGQFLHEQLSRLTMGWVDGRITNFDYLLHLNMLAGRSYNDLTQYPVMPWVLSNYVSEEIPDLTDPNNFRDLTKPVGALNPDRLRDFLERYETFADPTIPAFMYGSHYSTSAGVVYHFLVRMHPFAGLHRQLQGGYFDVADRLFSSVPRTWDMCTGYSAAEVSCF
jgi:Beige/BEACH domain/PH domain associated with Beige/BEACH